MMAFNPTPMQKLAINTDGNVLVAAAAGSGKTAVLTERVIRKLTDPKNPVSADRLLIVTFTNAAAAEMRSRIEKRLYEECAENPDDAGLQLQKQLISLAKICTIDSFCIDLVRENFEKCGVNPDFRVDDGSALKEINDRVMNATVSEHFAENSEAFRMLLELTGCEYDEKNLTDIIEEIYLYSRQLPFPEKFLSALIEPYEKCFDRENILYITAFDMAEKLLDNALEHAEKMAMSAELVSQSSEKHIAYSCDMNRMLETLKAESVNRDWDSFYDILGKAGVPNVPRGDKEDKPTISFREHKACISECLKQLKLMFSRCAEQIELKHKSLLPAIKLLIYITTDYGAALLEAYKNENTLTFYNTEQMALSLLCEQTPEGIKMTADTTLLNCYDEVLVDEFQDVNDLQNMLFYVLSNGDERLFVVGDVKQSIYGFRGSNPQNFLNKKNSYLDITEAKAGEPKKIILSDNFRSREGVCEFVNFFFGLFMNGQTGKLVYDEEESLRAAAKFPELSIPAAELIIAECTEESEISLLQSEAVCIADYIASVMNEGNIIRDSAGGLRKAKYSDFAILLNTMRNKAAVISAELMSRGIPVSYTAENYAETVEISVFSALLKVIDNPASDIELLTVMMSPIFGFTAEETAQIRTKHRSGSLYSAVIAAAKNSNSRCAAFLEKLAEYRRDAAMLPMGRLVSKLLSATDYLNVASAMPQGDIRRNNLLMLINLAEQYAVSSRGGISGFIRHIITLSEKGIKGNAVTSENSVSIMSMHKSKGLQFPICIIGNIASKINNADFIGRILYDEKMGIGFKYYDECTCETEETLAHRLIAAAARKKTIDERLRLLYVAMTRAEDRLVMVSAGKDVCATAKKIASEISADGHPITSEWLCSTQSMNQWVLAAALLHPDAGVLRKLADTSLKPQQTVSRLRVRFTKDICGGELPMSDSIKAETMQEDVAFTEELEAALKFHYKFDVLREIQAKSSVSLIANKVENDKFAFSEKPSFMHELGFSPNARGTAMHSIMQFISFEGVPDIPAELERLTDWQYITEKQAEAADIKALERFFESSLFERIKNAEFYRREMRFLAEMPASRIDNTLCGEMAEEKIVVQGAVDLCFGEADGIVVLDFKTDKVTDGEQLISAYSEQLEIYSKACEKIFERPVKEKLIYSFALSRTIKL